ncbi:filamentous hemagglutinin N-terminal domain-containing protein [Roseateles sp.]|uniref:filamentous hemagglutinin N-terminal domain-containing protein n=1 Tax=Roseateles sp. TaxID=1971397 RepID=UPI00326301C9
MYQGISQPSRQVLRRAAIRATRMQRSLQRALQRKSHRAALSKLALMVGWLMAGPLAHANPTGGQVVDGSATIQAGAPGTLNIFQQSNRAIIDWRSFSIGAGETVNFLQPAKHSVTLNRVLGNDPSAIFGQLNANGTVMLINPNGIVFGATSRVDVGGLVATTANIRNQDFMAGRYDFGQASANPNATIENRGHISIRDSGLAALVAPRVRNSGVIEARLGRVALGAANSFTLDFHGDGLLSFGAGSAISESPTEGGALVINSGEIRADGGSVLLTARALKGVIDQVINTDGIVSATTVSGQDGSIVLSGGGAGQVVVGGKVDASARQGGQGGSVVVTGAHVTVAGSAVIDVAGQAGGGEIALGSTGLSDAANPFADKSASLSVAAGARLTADATEQGRGGKVTLWSKDQTVFSGSISARGGAQGGDGGFAEVSSQKNIGLTGDVDLRAAKASTGSTGTFLIDPTDLRITDSASGGSLNGNAGDGSVAAGDANAGLNTVSRGLLEGLSGNTNIVLQATGQITVDAMAGKLINLATTAGHGFTLQSTLTGGIQFADAQTEIRTQGGAITLDAQGIGSTLSNIGKLTTNGGAVTLRATGDISLAGNINAGAGAVTALSTVGSIGNASGATPLLTGGAVSLSALGGHVGAAGNAVSTHTSSLTLASGGHLVAASDMALGSLSLTAAHVAPTDANDYQVSAPGLSFQVSDGAALVVTQITQSPALNLSLTSDRSVQLGTVNVGTGTLTLGSTGGNLLGAANTALTAASLTLSAQGSNGNNGAIGTSGQSLLTTAGHVDAVSGSGGVYLANTGALALDRLSTTGSSSVTATGALTVGDVNAGSATLALGSSGASVLDDGSATTRIAAGTLNLTAGAAIGSSGTPLSTSASTISANAASGGIFASTSATSSVLSSIVSGNGAIDIRTGGSSTLTSLTSSTSSASNGITVTATGTGSLSVGTVNAGAQGNVTLATTSGSISGNSGLITGETVTLNAASSGSVSVRTAAAHLDVQAGSSSISITQTGSVTLDRLSTPSTLISVTNSSGDITVGNVSTSTGGQVSLTASAGSILDDGNSATRIITGTATLNASGAIGTSSAAVQTKATGLTVTSTGDLFVTNTEATLTSLSITNRHSAPGNAGSLQVNSPYLTFDVTDTGTSYTLDHLVSVPLGSLSFNGDATLQLGQVQAAGSVSLTATQGNLVDDGNLQSRVTSGSTLTLSAAQGSVGSQANPIGVNASSLTLTTRGDLYVNSLTDLSTLTVTSTHADTTTSYGMAITAPSLKLSVSDSAAGHNVATLTDTSSLNLTFTSDRDITLGQVDVTNTGTARFTSSAGAIKDDGDKSTRVLANSTTFSGLAVGATGTGYMDVVTGTLAATASAGGVYVQLPMPTGSTNTTSTVTLGTITATGSVAITAVEGDLSLGGFMTATNQAVTLTALQGAILSPSGYSIAIGTGSLTLDAAKAIGASSRAVPVTSSAGATLTAQAGTSMWLSGSGPLTLSSLDAAASISYTQSSGAITVGHVDATAGGTVAITASSGAIQNDSDNATGIRANQVTLSAAQSSIGSGAALTVDAPKLLLTANGAIAVTDSATLDTLSVTRGSGSSGSMAITAGAGQNFTLSEDGTEHYVQAVSSSTPLAFSFSGQRNVKIGNIGVGSAGSASISSAASLTNDGVSGSGIAAGTVSLTAGTAGSIGAAGSGNAISLEGSTALTLSAGRNFFASSDTALTDLAITSTNTTTVAGTASVFGVSGLGQTFGITDSGSTQSLGFSGTALTNTSFTTRKNIQVAAITASGDVTLTTTGGGANSNISSDSGAGTIAGNRVLLTATSSTAGGGSIGSSGTALRVDTPTVILAGSGNVYVDDAQNVSKLDMTLTHGTATTFGYGVTAGNLSNFNVTDGSTQSLGMAVVGAMDFSYSVDRALSLSTVDAGTSSTGSISLTSRSAPTGTGAQINRSSGSLTGNSIMLSAVGSNGGVGTGSTLSTNTKNLIVASGGNVSVSNATTLTSLNLDARHNTSGSSTHSYSISSTGLTFSVSDTTGNTAFQLANISQSGLDLTVKADRVITASSINTGAGGKVNLNSGSYVQGGSGASAGSPSITTGDLSLNGGSAFGYQGSTPLYTAAGTLASSLSNTLYLSNAGALTLKTNTVAGSADVASSNNSLLQGSGGLFTTPTLKLSANQSLGSTGTLLTDTRRLTLVSRGNIDVSNASDLYALTMTSTHATAGVQNTIAVAAPRLALDLTDSVGGNQYHLGNLLDSSGLDFTLSTDVALSLGTVNAQAGRSLALYSTGSTTAITNDGGSLLTAGSITLSAGGSLGAAGGSGTRMQTNALGLTLVTGANAYADNAQDLSSLSLTSSQTAGGTAPAYQVTAPSLSFDITDDGTTRVNSVTDSTGLNFTLNTRRDQAVSVIDLGRSGSVSLTSVGDILGDADSSKRISAASASFYASNGGAVGSVGNPIHLSAPLTSFSVTGALNVESDTHIDRLGITVTHPTVTYGGAYSIVSVPISGAAYALFTATDSVTGTALTSVNDPLGLAFSFTGDRAMQVGSLNLGTTGTVTLTGTSSGGILGDGDPNTQVQAASLSMTSLGGAVGAAGSGNGIDATVNSVSATALSGSVNLALHGRTLLGSISGTSGVNLANDEGDIALGSINAGGSAVSINNQGGSILSGSIFNATTVALTASGSIGNTSAIGTTANGGGTTTLTASASAAHGAIGSIALSESYNLAASSVTAPAGVTLSSGYGLSAGTLTSGGAVALSSSQGSINGINSSNAITGTSVNLSARYGTGNGIGNNSVSLNVNTPQLVLNTPGSVYVTDTADLNLLTVDRTNYSSTGSSGTLSVIASGLTFSATDSANTTTLTSLADGTGLDFTYLGIGSLSVGSLNVGAGSLLLQAYLSSGNGNINAINSSSLITAGSLNLQAYGTGSNIGSSGTALGTAVGSLTASAGTGGMFLRQAGSLNLTSLSTTGDLAVTASSGDLTLGTLSYGSAKTLNLTASGGSILAGSGTLAGSGANAAITLSAANGIGTELAPVLVNASAGHTVNASVTGTGSLHLSSLSTLNGGLTTSVHDGSTTVTAAGSIKLTAMSSGTDAAGNDIRVTASAGDITVVSVSGGSGASFNAIDLSANAGRLIATPGTTLQAFDVNLHGATGVGDATNRMSANGQRVQVSSSGGAIYLGASTPSVLSGVNSNGGLIDISTAADLLLANASSGGGAITVASTTGGVALIAGNINAGAGNVSMSSTAAGGMVRDDGNSSTRVSGATVTLNGAGGVGSSTQAVGTSATTLALTGGSSGTGIFVNDANASGVTLASIIANGGAVGITTAGPTVATDVRAATNVAINASSGNLTVVAVTATAGSAQLTAAGAILGSGNGTHVTGTSVQLAAGGDIGTVTDTLTGAGAPVRVNTANLTGLSTTGSNAVISVRNLNTSTLTLSPTLLTMGSGSSAYLSSAGDVAFNPGAFSFAGNLLLSADGAIVLPTAGISTTGRLGLVGTDLSSAGGSPRLLTLAADSLYLRSGATGGATTLNSTAQSIDAALTGAGALTVNNTGVLTGATLATSNGDITATSSGSMTAGSVTAGGANRNIALSSTAGDLTVGTLNAGSNGTLTLSAANGSLFTASPAFTASALNLTAGTGIGSNGSAFDVSGMAVTAQVTGKGGIYVGSGTALTLGALTTANGDIQVTSAGNLNASSSLSAGQSGNVALTSTGGNLTLGQAFVNNGSDASRSGLALQAAQIALNGGGISTTGAQTYNGAVTLGANSTLSGNGVAFSSSVDGARNLTVNSGAGAASFGGAVGGTTRLGALVINSSGATTFAGAVNAASVTTDAAGTLAINGGSVNTTGAQSYGERAVLGASTTLTGTSVTLSGGADGSATLTIVGASTLGGDISTTGAQSYSGAVTLAADAALSGNGVAFASTVDGARNLTVNSGAGAASFGGAVGGTTRVGALTINSSGATTFSAAVNAASVTTDAAGTLAINGGSVDTTGAQSFGERAMLGASTTLTGDAVTLSGGADGSATLTIAGASTLGGDISTTGAQSYNGAVTLAADASFSANGVAFASTVDGARNLTVNSGAGAASFGGAVGGTIRLGALTVNSSDATTFSAAVNAASVTATGTLAINGGSVNTTGVQNFGDAVTLGSDATLSGNGVAFASAVDGARNLTVNSGAGAASFGGTVGGTTRVGALTINSSGATTFTAAVNAASVTTDAAGTLAINGGSVNTTGAQTFGERAVLGANTTLTGSSVGLSAGADGTATAARTLTIAGASTLGGDISSTGAQSYNGAVTLAADATLSGNGVAFSGSVDGARNLTVNSGAGAASFGGAVGGTTRLGALTVNSSGATTFTAAVNAASVTTTGTLAINGGSVNTTGAQNFGGAITLGADATLSGDGVAFASTVDGARNLTVNSGAGAASFGGTVGGTTRLGALVVNSSGATTFTAAVNAASVTTDAVGTLAINGGSVNTTGAQSFGERAVLGASTALIGSSVSLSAGADGSASAGQALTIAGASTLGGDISTTGAQSYNGAVTLAADATLSGNGVAFASTVDGARSLTVNSGTGIASFGGTVGGTTRLGALAVNSSGATTFAGSVNAASVTTDAAGTLAINGGSVNTTGAQSFGERAALGASTTLTGNAVSLSAGADATTTAGQTLTIAGASTLGGDISTTGAQSYNGAVTLATDATLSGNGVAFASTVDGARNLTVNSGAGAASFGGAVGGTTRVGALAVNSSGATTFAGSVNAASVTTDAAGSLAINGGSVNTTGAQSYGERAVLGASTTLTGNAVTLSGGADATATAGQTLTIAGASTLGGDVNSSGTQTYTGAVNLRSDTSLHSTGGSLVFGSTLDSAANGNLTLRADSGAIDVAGAVGGSGAIGALTLRSGTFTTFNGSVQVGSLAQSAAGGLTRFADRLAASGAGGLQFNGTSFRFDDAVTAALGGIVITNTDAAGTVSFAAGTTVQAATSFTQTGGAGVTLPAVLRVTAGPITLNAPATLPSGEATLSAQGDIKAVGLQGPATALTLNSGTGALLIGLDDATAEHKLAVGSLLVPAAGSAQLFGSVDANGGATAATMVRGGLANSPYFFNGTPWGPVGQITVLAAITAPTFVVPSRPLASALFNPAMLATSIAPNALEAWMDPQVLSLGPTGEKKKRSDALLGEASR